MPAIEQPVITHSLRGMVYTEIEVQGPKEDLHSGFWGGATHNTHNPALALVEILSKLYNPDNTITVPSFYDDVVDLTKENREMIAKAGLTDNQFKDATGVPAVWGDKKYTIRETPLRSADLGNKWHVEWIHGALWDGSARKIWPRRRRCSLSSAKCGAT